MVKQTNQHELKFYNTIIDWVRFRSCGQPKVAHSLDDYWKPFKMPKWLFIICIRLGPSKSNFNYTIFFLSSSWSILTTYMLTSVSKWERYGSLNLYSLFIKFILFYPSNFIIQTKNKYYLFLSQSISNQWPLKIIELRLKSKSKS